MFWTQIFDLSRGATVRLEELGRVVLTLIGVRAMTQVAKATASPRAAYPFRGLVADVWARM